MNLTRICTPGLMLCAAVAGAGQQAKPEAYTTPSAARVFITQSDSWEVSGRSAGFGGAGGSSMGGGARPQTAEIVKTFGERCPAVAINSIQTKADYIVLLDHEGGKGALRHKNKVAVFVRTSGDSIISKSTLSLGGSVQDACEAILGHWAEHAAELRLGADGAVAVSAPLAQSTPPMLTSPAAQAAIPPNPASATALLSIASTPAGADIEIDGNFSGSTPSTLALSEGDHTVSVKKPGYQAWVRKLKVNRGSAVHLDAALDQ